MTSSISNTLSLHHILILGEAPSSSREIELLLIDESCGDSAPTSKWEVACGLHRRVRRFFPEWRISGRDLLIEATGCLALAIIITLATRCLNQTMDSETLEFIKNQGEEIRQSTIEFIQKEGEETMQTMMETVRNQAEEIGKTMIEFIKIGHKEGIQPLMSNSNKWNDTETLRQLLLRRTAEDVKNETEKGLELYGGNLKNQTEKIMQIFTDPKEEHFGGFWWPTGVTCTVRALSRIVTAALKLYFPD